MTQRKRRVGDVLQFDLPDGTYAYGRVLRDACVGFYRRRTTEPGQPPIGDRDFEFIVGVYDDVAQSRPIVGHDPSANDDEDWPPPQRITDPIDGSFSIYHRGETRPSTEDESADLETAAVWDEQHLIERLDS
jgi:hypothetical protein